MKENEIGYLIRGAAFEVYKKLGPGMFESIYCGALIYELKKKNLKVLKEVSIPVIYEDLTFESGFRLDILVEDLVIIEVKSIENLAPVHYKQLTTYLKVTGKKLGYLINFNCDFLDKKSFVRIVNGL